MAPAPRIGGLPCLSAAQMREADRRCIEEIGIPGAVLMNNAGTAIAREITSGPVGIVCGKGNNGGDGFVAARLAHLRGLDTRVVLLAAANDLRGDAKTFHDICARLGVPIAYAPDDDTARRATTTLADCATLVDCILGTGFQGEVRGPARAAIEAWPPVWTLAADLPSGLHTDTGQPCGPCIRADVTVTFQWPKLGFAQPAAAPWIGRLVIADIGIPACCACAE